MRILYDFEAFSDQSHGGISRYVIELASRIAKADNCEVMLFAGWHRNQHLKSRTDPWIRGQYLKPFWRTGELRRRFNGFLTRRAISDFRPDIIHRTYHRHVPDYPGKHKTVVTIHDLTYFHYPESFPGGEIVRRRLERAARESDHSLCDTENTRQDVIRILGLPLEQTSVVHLGVNLPQNNNAHLFDPSNPFLLYVGQRSGYKNFRWLLETLSRHDRLASSRLIAFGGGDFTRDEKDLISGLDLQDRIQHKAGDDSFLADFYRRAGTLVYPSLYEGFGLPLLEAMAHGCPVVCSNASSLPEVGGEAVITYPPEDSEAFAKAVRTVVSDIQFRRQLVDRGYQRAREFSWDRCAEKTLQVYRDLVPED